MRCSVGGGDVIYLHCLSAPCRHLCGTLRHCTRVQYSYSTVAGMVTEVTTVTCPSETKIGELLQHTRNTYSVKAQLVVHRTRELGAGLDLIASRFQLNWDLLFTFSYVVVVGAHI